MAQAFRHEDDAEIARARMLKFYFLAEATRLRSSTCLLYTSDAADE